MNYITNDTELTSVANAIRTKGGTSAQLVYPSGFVTAINNIPTGGGGIVTNKLNGEYIDGDYSYTYEFDPNYGSPDAGYILSIEPGQSGYYEGGYIDPVYGVGYYLGAYANFQLALSTGELTITNPSSSYNRWAFANIVFAWGYGGSESNAVVYDSDFFMVGYYYNPCYLKGTMITLANGDVKPVEDITYVDKLTVWNFDEGHTDTAYPLWIKRPQTKGEYYHLVFRSGKTLDVVGMDGNAHRLFDCDTNRFEYSPSIVGHRVATENGIDVLEACIPKQEECTYYNIVTDYHMNVYANTILTSCRYNNIYPIENMKFVKKDRIITPYEEFDVPRKFYDGFRLGEQKDIDINEANEYVMWRVDNSI